MSIKCQLAISLASFECHSAQGLVVNKPSVGWIPVKCLWYTGQVLFVKSQLNISQIGQTVGAISLKCQLNMTYVLVVQCISVKSQSTLDQVQCQCHFVKVSVEYQSTVSGISLNCQGYITQAWAKSRWRIKELITVSVYISHLLRDTQPANKWLLTDIWTDYQPTQPMHRMMLPMVNVIQAFDKYPKLVLLLTCWCCWRRGQMSLVQQSSPSRLLMFIGGLWGLFPFLVVK